MRLRTFLGFLGILFSGAACKGPGNAAATIPVSQNQSGGTVSSITQNGITWTFDKVYPVGQFVGGDYYVVGPVTITSVSPGWNGQTNGSMLDPVPVAAQGLDSRISAYYAYDDNARVKFPISISGIKSLVSMIGLPQFTAGGAYATMSNGAVLTILNQVPPTGTFRPPYVAGNKPLWNTAQVNYQVIPTLAVPIGATVPNLSNVMTLPVFQFGPQVWMTTITPTGNIQDPYPAYNCTGWSQMALAMMLNIPEKRDYINREIQQGIDIYSISLQNDVAFAANGGFGTCYKLPILIAGLALGDSGMKAPPLFATSFPTLYKFSEDGYTYVGAPTTQYPSGKPMFGIDWTGAMGLPMSACTSNCMARDPSGVLYPEQMPNGGGYRQIVSPVFVGQALAARLLNVMGLWNHPIFFDYEDQYVNDPASWTSSSDQFKSDAYGYGDSTGFVRMMWQTYR